MTLDKMERKEVIKKVYLLSAKVNLSINVFKHHSDLKGKVIEDVFPVYEIEDLSMLVTKTECGGYYAAGMEGCDSYIKDGVFPVFDPIKEMELELDHGKDNAFINLINLYFNLNLITGKDRMFLKESRDFIREEAFEIINKKRSEV